MLTINPEARKEVIGNLLGAIRAETNSESVEKTRRALASEIQRLIDRISLEPTSFHAYEVIGLDPSWKDTYGVTTEDDLEGVLRLYGFTTKVLYRNGDVQIIEGGDNKALKFKESEGMKKLKLRLAAAKV